jgi:hypothetical protein
MADDIVQTIVIKGDDQATPVLGNIAQQAKQLFAQISQAAQTAGSAVSSFSQAFGQSFTTSFQAASQAAQQHGNALNQVGQAANTTSGHVRGLQGEIRALREAFALAGLTGAGTATTIAQIGLHLGPVAAAFAAIGAAIYESISAANAFRDSALALDRASQQSGISVDQLGKQLAALARQTGTSTGEVAKQFENLFGQIKREAPLAAIAIEQSSLKIIQAQQAVAQSALNLQQAQLQGKQISLQVQQLQLQLQYLPQIQAIETKRADLAVRDAAARLQILGLQKQYNEGTIDDIEYQERLDSINRAAAAREIEKARLDLEAAQLQKQQLADQQALQRKQLALQQELLAQQQRANDLAVERAKTEQQLAIVLEKIARAQDLGKLVEQAKLLEQGFKVAIDPLTTMDSLTKAIAISLGQTKDPIAAFANLLAALPAAKAFDVQKAFGLSNEMVEVLRKGAGALTDAAAAAGKLGLAITEEQITVAKKYSDKANELAGNLKLIKEQAGAIVAVDLTKAFSAFNETLVGNINNVRTTIAGTVTEVNNLTNAMKQLGASTTGGSNILENTKREFQGIIDFFSGPGLAKFNFFKTILDAIFTPAAAAEAPPDPSPLTNAIVKEVDIAVTDAQPRLADAAANLAKAFSDSFGKSADFTQAFSGLATAFANMVQQIRQLAPQITSAMVQAFQNTEGSINAVLDNIINKIQQAVQAAQQLNQQLQGQQPGSGLPMASGCEVHGKSGTDANLAWLTSGEFIMNTRAVQNYGLDMMHAMNSLRAPRFATGGLNLGSAQPRLANLSSPITGQRVLHLSIEGRSFSGLSIPENTAKSLERFAVNSQIASTGRKPSWRR